MRKETREISATLTGRIPDEYLILTVTYDKGGLSYFTYKEVQRGYYLNLSVRTRTIENGFRIEQFTMFNSGLRHFIEPANRFNAKRLAEIVPDQTIVDGMKSKVLEMTLNKGA